jgi:DNA-binding transcriptional LysR family regulator
MAGMDWNDLKCFTVLASTGTLSAAARQLKVDHSTIARRIATLEQDLGARLFDRLPRGYALTPDGKRLVEQAMRVEEEVFALVNATRARMGVAVLLFFMGPFQAGLVRLDNDSASAPQSRDLWMVAHSDVRRSPTVRIVMDHLVELIDRDRAFLEGKSRPMTDCITDSDGSPAARMPGWSA